MPLPRDAILSDLVHKLDRMEDRLPLHSANMADCEEVHGTAFLRIGVTGEGSHPNILIEYDVADGPPVVYGTYYWTGTPLVSSLAGEWSERRMTLAAVRALL